MDDRLRSVPILVALLAFVVALPFVGTALYLVVFWPYTVHSVYWPFVPRGYTNYALLVGILLVPLLAGLPSRRRPRLDRTGVALVGGFWLVAMVPFLAGIVNGALDTSPTEVHRAEVLEKQARWNDLFWKDLVVRDWATPDARIRFSVRQATFDACAIGDTVEVVSHPGKLGIEWWSSVSACERPR
jgi:hypothetical protein